jgi:hypothetical protein
MCRKFTHIFTTNFVGSLDIRAFREVFPIGVRSPEIIGGGGKLWVDLKGGPIMSFGHIIAGFQEMSDRHPPPVSAYFSASFSLPWAARAWERPK